jgi:hypothetical protein
MTEVGRGETIFEEPESVDMGWLNEYGEMTPPASVWVSTPEEEIEHDARLSQGARKSSDTSRSRRSEEQRFEDVRRSKDSWTSGEIDHYARWSQGTKTSSNTSRSRRSEEQRTADIRRSKDSGMSGYSQRSRVNMRRSQDSRMSDESLRSAEARIAAEKWIEELRIADERLARVRNGQGYRDCNLL